MKIHSALMLYCGPAFAAFALSACSMGPNAGPYNSSSGPPGSTQSAHRASQALPPVCNTAKPATCLPSQVVHVPNFSGATITFYPLTANGNFTPSQSIDTTIAGMQHPDNIYEDPAGKIYASQASPSDERNRSPVVANEIAIFTPSGGGFTAQTIIGESTGLSGPIGVAVDSSGRVYVANCGNGTITVYAAGATGNASPLSTRGDFPCITDLEFDASQNLYVTLPGDDTVEVYGPGPNGAFLRLIHGTDTQLNSPRPIAFDSAGNMYIGNNNDGKILVYAPGASGDAIPIRVITGGNTGLGNVTGLSFDASGRLYATVCPDCSGSGGGPAEQYVVFAPGANGNATPLQVVTGSNTGLNGPTDIFVGK